MPDCRFEEYFLPATPETTFGDETLAGPNLSARRTQSGGIPTWLYDVYMSAHVYHCAKNSGGFPNTRWKSDTISR